jgi:hypothetical protein
MYTNLVNNIADINTLIKSLQITFNSYIQDKDVPLEQRWKHFCKANYAFKTHNAYGSDFKSLPDDLIMYGGPIHMERYQVMTAEELINRIEGFVSEPEYDEIYVDIDAVKEEILSNCLGSFTFDW